MKLKISENLIKLAKLVSKKASLYIVGGFVRNAYLGIGGTDVDLTSSLTPEELEKLTENTEIKIGNKQKKLGTVIITCGDEQYEHTTFRKDTYLENSGEHTPSKVEFIKDLKQDAKRRDFTINAIYYDILKDEIIDVYGGLSDLKKRMIRTVETPSFVFESDGLRILRMVRFACELNLRIARETFAIAKKMSYRLNDITGSRKFSELELILNSDKRFEISKKKAYIKGLKMINLLGVWSFIFQNASKIKINIIKKVKPEERFVGLLIDLINSVKPDCVSYYLKFVLGNESLMLSKSKADSIIEVVSGYFDAINGVSNKKFFFNYFNCFERIDAILQKTNAFKHLKYGFFYNYIIKFKIPIQVKDLKINGNDIKANFPKLPEKKYSIILLDLLDKVFEAKLKNEKEELLKEINKMQNAE